MWPTRMVVTVLATALVLGATGCGDDDGGADTAAGTGTTSTTGATTTTAEATTTSTTAGTGTTVTEPGDDAGEDRSPGRSELEDGQHFGYWSSVEATAEGATGELDLAYFLTGEEAEAEAAARGDEVDNDYYIVNDNPRLRTLLIARDADVQVLEQTGSPTLVPSDVASFVAGPHDRSGYWVTVVGGVVTAVEEQYVP